jgi:ABC-type uncharacterized transport system ATPase subunit
VVALRGAGVSLSAGEVHALLGENGAGKTTLLRVLGGVQPPDRGELLIDGRPVRLRTARDAWAAGIGLVHQHFTLVPRLTVLENLALGARAAAGPLGGLSLPLARTAERAVELAAGTGLSVPLDVAVETLGVGDRQRVEILKVLLREPRVLALDEPTAVLAPAEVEGLLTLLRKIAAGGRAVVIVAHKLDEALAVADRVTVLREGRTVLEASRDQVDARALAAAMVGEERTRELESAPLEAVGHQRGALVARLDGVVLPGGLVTGAGAPVSLDVHRGEIVGVAGVEGNGQRELALVLAGRAAPMSGRVELPADPGFVPQDRSREGLIGELDLAENVALALHRRPEWRRGQLMRWDGLRAATREMIARYQVRAPGPHALARTLSGGNQQRMVVARELAGGRELLVAENPTRGLDVAATAFVHGELRRLRAKGTAGVVLVSSDLDEVLELADRILVMVRGRLTEVPAGVRSRAAVGALMLSARAAG